MSDNPRTSPQVRVEIHTAMNALVREASDIVTRRSRDGQWLPPGEIAELGTNTALGRAAEVWVLERLESRIREAREVIERVQRDSDAWSGVTGPEAPGRTR
ncbi:MULTISPECIES: hypothetical protein [unclassified Streptomyces]|uniref:hypothetical protein n=1 Tax=unclassified Streptomyces TaxID=2593676 RepID=UPI00380175FD|nr:hypothetical protein OG770_18330 [Streptomyces sp. NBC_01185]